MPATPCPPVPRSNADPLAVLADRCVQCGLCLPACPTYSLDRIETESPRGRIALVRAWTSGRLPPGPAGDAHLDHCLGCGNCESACPAGVEYGSLLIAARAQQRARRQPSWRQRVIEALSARPNGLRRLLQAYRIVHAVLPAPWRPLPRPPARSIPAPPERAADSPRRQVAVFSGCVARSYEASLREALAQLCAALGFELVTPAGQTCCGSVHAHAGDTAQASRLAAINRDAFADHSTVLTLASGCHGALVAALDDGKGVDALNFLHAHADRLRFRPLRARVALHLPCTQRNASHSAAAMHALLARVPGLLVLPLDAGHGCCGAAGSQMLTEPTRARAYRQPLLQQLEHLQASRLLSANIGCRLHLGNGTKIAVQHPLELLAEQLQTG